MGATFQDMANLSAIVSNVSSLACSSKEFPTTVVFTDSGNSQMDSYPVDQTAEVDTAVVSLQNIRIIDS